MASGHHNDPPYLPFNARQMKLTVGARSKMNPIWALILQALGTPKLKVPYF
jgi:hypothetical protein